MGTIGESKAVSLDLLLPAQGRGARRHMDQGLGEHRKADMQNTQDIESGQFLARRGIGFPMRM